MVRVQSVFKTLCGSSITRLELGGPSGHQQDRIFVASAAIVRGYTRRGKQFLDFNSNKTEAIRSLYDVFSCFYVVCTAGSWHQRSVSDAPSLRSVVVDEDRLRPVDDVPSWDACFELPSVL